MNHYDDLQRFKDKTRNQQHDFKDFSAQNTAHDQGNWALINQLSPASDDNKLAMGGHVSLPQPQPINPALFTQNESVSGVASVEPTVEIPAQVTPGAVAPILRDVAQQLSATRDPLTAPVPAPIAPPAPAAAPLAQPAPKPHYSAPVQPASVATEPASYARLFAPKPAETRPAVEKNQPLHTLLERIASCR
ncbi:cellulose biosynthesis protein BcsO [Phytobacter sp. AG2a]